MHTPTRPGTHSYARTQRQILNTYCFSTVTVVTRRGPIVTNMYIVYLVSTFHFVCVYRLHILRVTHNGCSEWRPLTAPSVVETRYVVARPVRGPWRVTNSFTCCCDSSYQILFCFNKGLVSDFRWFQRKKSIAAM